MMKARFLISLVLFLIGLIRPFLYEVIFVTKLIGFELPFYHGSAEIEWLILLILDWTFVGYMSL